MPGKLSGMGELLRRLQSDKSQGFPLFPMLPADIHYEIGSFLPPISLACLALTCKPLFDIHREALSSRDLQFPQSFQHRFQYRCHADSFKTIRWQFLGYLEDRRWKRCSRCLKLHPVRKFPRSLLSGGARRKNAEKRLCNHGRNSGIVDLCPCIRLTYRDKQRLIEQLQLDPNRARYLGELDFSEGSPHIWHQCEIPGSRIYTTKIFPVLENGELRIVTTYDIRDEPEDDEAWSIMRPVRLCCPHLCAIVYWRFTSKAKTHPNDPYTVPYSYLRNKLKCRWCATTTGDFKESHNNVHFKTIRYLGPNGPRPDMTWFNQTVYAPDRYKDPYQPLDRYPFWNLARFRPDLFRRSDLTIEKLGGLC